MRNEASLEMWKELYDVTLELLALEPWGYFWDMDLVAVTPDAAEEPLYCSIMGRIGSCYGIGVYPGAEGLCDLQMIASSGQNPLPPEYIMYEQSSLCCYCGDREEVPPQQKKIIKALGYKFRGKGKWVYYHSFRRRYSPYTPDQAEVLMLTQTFQGLLEAVKAVINGANSSAFKDDRILCAQYDKNADAWNLSNSPMPDVQKSYPLAVIQDDVLKQRLKKRPVTSPDLLLDFCYINASIEDLALDRPVNPLLFLAMNARTGAVLDTRLLKPEETEIDAALDFFLSHVMEHGRMNTVMARNPWIFSALEDICRYCGIELILDPLDEIDKFISSFKESLRHH